MNSRYLCRAKRIDTREWVYGYLMQQPYGMVICYKQKEIKDNKEKFITVVVDPETICQCTGCEGIFENDIFDDRDGYRYIVEWCEYDLAFEAAAVFTSELIGLGEFSKDEINIIGNIFDNPELLD